jgi:hypothetical protein
MRSCARETASTSARAAYLLSWLSLACAILQRLAATLGLRRLSSVWEPVIGPRKTSLNQRAPVRARGACNGGRRRAYVATRSLAWETWPRG